MIASTVGRGRRPDGTYEVWRKDRPFQSIYGLGRFESWLVAAVLRVAPNATASDDQDGRDA